MKIDDKKAWSMRQDGMTFKDIGKHFAVSRQGAHLAVGRHQTIVDDAAEGWPEYLTEKVKNILRKHFGDVKPKELFAMLDEVPDDHLLNLPDFWYGSLVLVRRACRDLSKKEAP